jgi:hypothetical protein
VLGSEHQPGAGVGRDAVGRPLFQSGDQGILRQFLGQADISDQPGQPGDDPGRFGPSHRLDRAMRRGDVRADDQLPFGARHLANVGLAVFDHLPEPPGQLQRLSAAGPTMFRSAEPQLPYRQVVRQLQLQGALLKPARSFSHSHCSSSGGTFWFAAPYQNRIQAVD